MDLSIGHQEGRDIVGRIRKVLSISTFGLVRFRNEKEKTLKAIKKSNRIAKKQLRQQEKGL